MLSYLRRFESAVSRMCKTMDNSIWHVFLAWALWGSPAVAPRLVLSMPSPADPNETVKAAIDSKNAGTRLSDTHRG